MFGSACQVIGGSGENVRMGGALEKGVMRIGIVSYKTRSVQMGGVV